MSENAGSTVFHGLPVYSLKDKMPGAEETVCVLVHEAVLPEIEEIFTEKGITNAAWIYPVLHETVFGKAVKETDLSVSDILLSQDPEENWLEIRAAGVLACLEADESGVKTALYRKGMGLFSQKATVRNREERVRELVRSIKTEGFKSEHPILLDENMRMIDGLHRLAAACFLGIRRIPCRIVRASEKYTMLLDAKTRAEKTILRENGFSDTEMRMLGRQRDKLQEDAEEKPAEAPEVSVILPVFNVEGYLDQCLESLRRQTFTDFEILMINDGSTDGSDSLCEKWAEKDSRIRYIRQENRGVSPSRNRGVALARGKYLAFIDPDDWVEPDYLETLHTRLEETGAPYAECDIMRYNERTGKEVCRSVYGKMGIAYTLREHMKYAPTASYKSMFRKELWTENGVHMPDCAFESPAVYALVIALAGGVESIRRPLYHYRVGRPGSLIEIGYGQNVLGTEAMSFLISEFKRCGLYETYRDTLEELVKYRLSDILATQFYRRSPSDYAAMAGNSRGYLKEMFPDSPEDVYMLWGGFALNRILVYMNRLQDPYGRFNFSSLISLMEPEREGTSEPALLPEHVRHKNAYRQIMLRREAGQGFWQVLREIRPAWLFLDLVGERFDILEYGGRYFTDSDVLEGAEIYAVGPEGPTGAWIPAAEFIRTEESAGKIRRIPQGSEECSRLFEDAFRQFTRRLTEGFPRTRLVIVENYLSEKKGDTFSQEEFPEIADIRRTNRILKGYYEFVKQTCPDAPVIPAYSCLYYFTDREYEYGAVPPHLNEVVNKSIAHLAQQEIETKR